MDQHIEKIEDIAKAIERHRSSELTISASNEAVARIGSKFNNKLTTFWLTNQENKGAHQPIESITGRIVGAKQGNPTTVTNDGASIYKGSRLGEILIINYEGVHSFAPRDGKGEVKIEIFNKADYTPDKKDLAVNLSIQLAGMPKPNRYRDLRDILRISQEIAELIRREAIAEEKEKEALLQNIRQKEVEKDAILKRRQSFVRKSAELRYQPILDPTQETIKRSNIFNGTLAIDGGPGTGKTTVLIQRIKFLISESISEYATSADEKQKFKKVVDTKQNWIFFSPSELLALYLKNSMVSEGLNADYDSVKVWDGYKTVLIRAYKIVDIKGPFLMNNTKMELIISNGAAVKNLIKSFTQYYLEYKRNAITKISKMDVTEFEWNQSGISIKNYLEQKLNGFNWDQWDVLINLFLNLQNNYSEDVETVSKEYKKIIEGVAAQFQSQIKKDKSKIQQIENLLKNGAKEQTPDEEEIEKEKFEEIENSQDFDAKLFLKIKSLCRKYALQKYDKQQKFTKEENQLIDLIPTIKDSDKYTKLGQLAYFKKHIESITKGIVENIFREIPMVYKQFRCSTIAQNLGCYQKDLLAELTNKDNNRKLHRNEQAFLLYFINSLIKEVYKGTKPTYESTDHSYFKAFKAHSKHIIGVDEATDFHLIDLLAIHSFGDLDISSVTYSGDHMQRMASFGLKDWQELNLFIGNFDVKKLTISYRQSPTLLHVAKVVYEKATNKPANYNAYMEKDSTEPKPLLFQYDEESIAIDWIAQRIHEIYKAYNDNIPSIAIFLPSEDNLDKFSKSLGQIDQLASVPTNKVCGNCLKLRNFVPIRVIKKQTDEKKVYCYAH